MNDDRRPPEATPRKDLETLGVREGALLVAGILLALGAYWYFLV